MGVSEPFLNKWIHCQETYQMKGIMSLIGKTEKLFLLGIWISLTSESIP
jgi:hypothetical protein